MFFEGSLADDFLAKLKTEIADKLSLYIWSIFFFFIPYIMNHESYFTMIWNFEEVSITSHDIHVTYMKGKAR